MREFETYAMINSLQGQDRVTVVFQNGSNDIIVRYRGSYYTAIFNPFVGTYYVDDIYGNVNPQTLKARGII